MYKHPGVYIEHVPSNMLSIEAAATSVTAFVGHVKRGVAVTDKNGEPEFISSVSQYAQRFGPLGGGAGGIRNEGETADAFGHAINAFFANGGTQTYIVPVAKSKGTASIGTATLSEGTVKLTATSRGKWADNLIARFDSDLDGEYTLTLGTKTGKTEKIINSARNEVNHDVLDVLEVFTNLKLDADSGQFIDTRINGTSLLVTATLTSALAVQSVLLPLDTEINGGVDSSAAADADYQLAFERLQDYRAISIIVLPGLNWSEDKGVYERALTHAEFMKNRMVIIDSKNPSKDDDQLKTPKDVRDAGFPTSPYAALYYPHMIVSNQYFEPETAANLPATFEIGPAGMAAGLWGRIDSARGVWKAPAGLEATVRGSLGPNVLIGNAIQDNLNEWGVNCIRSIIGPTVVWGARTLATKANPQFRYISVRRTQNMIGESLYNALKSVVFEPNDHKLWSSLRAGIGNFMDALHRAGAFQGEKTSDAYYVHCGLGSTMTQGDIDAGIVRVVVGFAPLKPAEFVVVQIQQIVGQAA